MSGSRRDRLEAENTRLKSALAAIHNHLHADDVNAAHEACECAITGKVATQAHLSAADAAGAMDFAAAFNALADHHKARACCVLLLPSTTPGATSIQLLGDVIACQVVERAFGNRSVYMGDHNAETP